MSRWQKFTVKVGELATGHELTLPVFRFEGRDPAAPSVYIQANVHGAEVQGNAVIFQLMKRLEQLDLLGRITLVPLANPLGINQKSGEFTLGRFDPITGVNWNREYQDLTPELPQWFDAHRHLEPAAMLQAYRQHLLAQCERQLASPWGVTTGRRLALSLQAMAHRADIVLDLHTGPKSCKHLYCPGYAKDAARLFAIPCVLLMPNEFGGAMDEAAFYPWWQLAQYASNQGMDMPPAVEAFTLELGSQERIDLQDAQQDCDGILAYLTSRCVVNGSMAAKTMTRYACELRDYRKYHSPVGGLVEYLATPGHPLPAGEPLARILRPDRFGHQDEQRLLCLDEDVIPVLHFASASVYQGTELYKVMTRVTQLT
ncbi:succinylglutamate desuccinylase/aspartoacylase family protein [Shewanella sp. GXUN23E]|uniref:succinylglutamate desuccinylase/aspartoacylase family protein n=1 Tax=Shewanella sp. GXUN23E TaxID=3422498 RepID=UPI003D7EE67C